jgi:hypothetical protein
MLPFFLGSVHAGQNVVLGQTKELERTVKITRREGKIASTRRYTQYMHAF